MIERTDPNYIPFKKERDGRVVLPPITKAVGGKTGDRRVTLYLESTHPTTKRVASFQCVMRLEQATQLSTVLAALVDDIQNQPSTS